MSAQISLNLPGQPSRPDGITAAVNELAEFGDAEQRGAVFTTAPIVEAIYGLVDYTADRNLADLRLLEPSFGDGSFLFIALKRLLTSYFSFGGSTANARCDLADAIRAVEIHHSTFVTTRKQVVRQLVAAGISDKDANELADIWLTQDDFLLTNFTKQFDIIIGNPPYVRQERIPNILLAEYKKRFDTIYDRADLYIPFFERCLDLLSVRGKLGFICANRWIKNKYGGPLRQKISTNFRLLYYIDLEQKNAFGPEILAYPAITIVTREQSGPTYISLHANPTADGMARTVSALKNRNLSSEYADIFEVDELTSGRDPWLLNSPKILGIIRQLERQLPTLEEAGCKVGIGVATGCDKVFIQDYEQMDVEASRKLPLVLGKNLQDGKIEWSGQGVLNPFMSDGSLASLSDYPRFAAFLKQYKAQICARHVAKKSPHAWYRTIDRIYPKLLKKPKLLIPDIKGDATVVYDPGHFYPHHNLYVITSNTWELRALQAVLRSSISVLFVAAYCVRMSGGFLRFQAQYLRRIRIPKWEDISEQRRRKLKDAADEPDQTKLDALVLPIFNLSTLDQNIIREFAETSRTGQSK